MRLKEFYINLFFKVPIKDSGAMEESIVFKN